MKEKILYFLGAGASVNALPLAKSVGDPDSRDFISGLAKALRTFDFYPITQELNKNNIDQNIVDDIKKRFTFLSERATEFGDVDTYAKYLHLMEQTEKLHEVKQTLSEFFILKQVVIKSQDPRYLPWLVSIMNKKTFPENVKILNWNYDFQIQRAFEQIGELEDIQYEGTSYVHSPSLLTYYPSLDPSFSNYHLLSLIHLNGIAGYAGGNELGLSSVFQQKVKDKIDLVVKFLEERRTNTLLHFAWEKSNYHEKLLEHIREMIDRTTIVVVIGYSFPFFNREIDKNIFDKLKKDTRMRKIYYQDPVLDGEQLRAQFDLSHNLKIVHIKKTDNFHIPFEY